MLLKRVLRDNGIHLSGIKGLKQPDTIGRALTVDEKTLLLEKLASHSEWEVAYHAAVLALNTTMRRSEIAGLRWRSIDFLNGTLIMESSKTEAGKRVIPFGEAPAASEVLVKLRAQAEAFGPVEPEHFVFPSTYHGYDPTKPVRGWRTAWRAATKAAGLRGLRFHDLRHHAITEMLENGVPESTVEAIAGHVSPKILARYSHTRLEAKREALKQVFGKQLGTNRGTGPKPQAAISPQVVDSVEAC
jgi:integrase